MAKKETAEQKLLKLIEASAGTGAVAVSKGKQQVIPKQSVLSVIKLVNNVLLIAVCASVLFLIKEVGSGIVLINKRIQFPVNSAIVKNMANATSLVPSVHDLAFYMGNVNHRNLFQPFDKQPTRTVVESTDGNRRIVQMTRNLRLVGISWLDHVDTASVMIEDKNKQTTYFLRQGENVGGVTVKTIYADSALLGYEDEEMIIKYDKPSM